MYVCSVLYVSLMLKIFMHVYFVLHMRFRIYNLFFVFLYTYLMSEVILNEF